MDDQPPSAKENRPRIGRAVYVDLGKVLGGTAATKKGHRSEGEKGEGGRFGDGGGTKIRSVGRYSIDNRGVLGGPRCGVSREKDLGGVVAGGIEGGAFR